MAKQKGGFVADGYGVGSSVLQSISDVESFNEKLDGTHRNNYQNSKSSEEVVKG